MPLTESPILKTSFTKNAAMSNTRIRQKIAQTRRPFLKRRRLGGFDLHSCSRGSAA